MSILDEEVLHLNGRQKSREENEATGWKKFFFKKKLQSV